MHFGNPEAAVRKVYAGAYASLDFIFFELFRDNLVQGFCAIVGNVNAQYFIDGLDSGACPKDDFIGYVKFAEQEFSGGKKYGNGAYAHQAAPDRRVVYDDLAGDRKSRTSNTVLGVWEYIIRINSTPIIRLKQVSSRSS